MISPMDNDVCDFTFWSIQSMENRFYFIDKQISILFWMYLYMDNLISLLKATSLAKSFRYTLLYIYIYIYVKFLVIYVYLLCLMSCKSNSKLRFYSQKFCFISRKLGLYSRYIYEKFVL